MDKRWMSGESMGGQNDRVVIASNRGAWPKHMKVRDLILDDYSGWNESLVRQVL